MLLIIRSARPALAAAAAVAVVVPPPHAVAGDGGSRGVVVASTSIWADVVDQLDCTDALDVEALIPAGGDPHSYEPSMQDRDRLAGASLVIINGAGLEEGLADTIDAARGDGATVFAVTDHVTTHDRGDEHTGDDADDHSGDDADDHSGDDADPDPHVWLDPTLVAQAVPALRDALVGAGADAGDLDVCADELAASLADLDRDIAAVVDTIPPAHRVLVTNHDALGYFARRYGFEILGSVLPSTSTLVEASPGELDALAAAIERAGVPAIFAEALESTDDSTALADRLGIDVVPLYTDSLGDEDSGAATYQDLLRTDAELIADALRP